MSEVAEELVQAASTEIAEYSRTETALADLRARMANVEYDVTTTKGMAVAKADRAEVRGLRTGLEAMRKSIKAPALAHCKLIDAEAQRITAELLKLEEPIDQQIKKRESELESEKAAREAAEKARVIAITDRIAGIRQYVELAASCRTAARIYELQEKLARISLDGFEEFADEAVAAHADAMKRVEALLVEKHLQEQEQEKAKAEQAAAAAKLAAERAEFAAAQAEAKAEADRQAKEIADSRAAHEAEVLRVTKANRDAAIAEADRIATERQRLDDERKAFEDQKLKAKVQEVMDRVEAMASKEQSDLADLPSVSSALPPAPEAVDSTPIEPLIPLTDFESPAATACESAEPSDGDLIWTAQMAIAAEYGLTTQQAFNRLKAIDWTI
jgi:hypothetical protein